MRMPRSGFYFSSAKRHSEVHAQFHLLHSRFEGPLHKRPHSHSVPVKILKRLQVQRRIPRPTGGVAQPRSENKVRERMGRPLQHRHEGRLLVVRKHVFQVSAQTQRRPAHVVDVMGMQRSPSAFCCHLKNGG